MATVFVKEKVVCLLVVLLIKRRSIRRPTQWSIIAIGDGYNSVEVVITDDAQALRPCILRPL